MLKKILKWTKRLLLWTGAAALAFAALANLFARGYAAPRMYAADKVPARRAAIVFGAGLLRDGSAGPVLRDRVQTAAKLYQAGKVEKLLMSGDNRFVNYNEPEAMRQYALSLGAPDADIVLDYAGRRTYDTCYRAKVIFGVDSAALVTQAFHLPRALVLCNALGVESVGAKAENLYFLKRSRLYWNVREIFAIPQALLDLYLFRPQPVLGEPEPIQFE